MSGGSMEYIGYRVELALEDIQCGIEHIELMTDKADVEHHFKVSDCYKHEHPDAPFLRSPSALRRAVLKRLRDAERTVRLAAIYLTRTEWLASGDDDYESFVLRTDEEIKKGETK